MVVYRWIGILVVFYLAPLPSFGGNEYDTLLIHKLYSGAYRLRFSEPDSAFYYLKLADSTAVANVAEEWHARCLRLYGALYFMEGDYVKALERHQTSLDYYKTTDRRMDIARSLYNIGLIYSKTGYYPKAISYFTQALKICDQYEYIDLQGVILNSLGVVSKHLKQYRDAISHYRRAFDAFRITKNHQESAGTLSNIANIYLLMDRPDSAILLNKQALSMFDSLDLAIGRVRCLNNLADCFRRTKAFDSARYYVNESLTLTASQRGLHSSGLNAMLMQAQIFFDQSQYQDAIKVLDTLIKGIDGKERSMLLTAYNLLSSSHERSSNYKSALNALQQSAEIRDSLFNEQMTAAITETKLDYELDRKTNEIDALKAENSAKDFYLLSILLIVALVVAVVVLVIMNWNFRLKKKKEVAELKALQAQMNPHFIFNSLNSINRYITKADAETASSYLVKFSRLIRLVLENSNQDSITLENELTVLQLYVDMERLRFNNKFDMSINVVAQVNINALYVPALILQPFVENSILHGLSGKKGYGMIKVEIKQSSDHLFCIIEDNGVGRDISASAANKRQANKTSLGMSTTYLRLRALTNNAIKKADVDIIDLHNADGSASGTRVELRLPLVRSHLHPQETVFRRSLLKNPLP
jgi:tetratricopeptide (TPR) repeat protein